MVTPKLFISYSWSSVEHEQRVLDLATELVESGVDAILDKWNLKEGDDADVFMEQMVANPEIQKVLIICDKKYSEKSDKRTGGAGTEAQIISRKIYEQSDEGKFVVAAFEIDEQTGKPYLPVYYGSRKYIDFTDPNKFAIKFEELIRWIFNKPLYVKPKLGRAPDYILADEKKTLGTTSAYKRALSYISEGRSNATGAIREYLARFSANLELFLLPSSNRGDDYYSMVINSINDILPYREEWLDVLNAVCTNELMDSVIDDYIRFFEEIHAYTQRRYGISYYDNQTDDNIKFIEHELMLCFIALLLKKECFNSVSEIFNATFYNKSASSTLDSTFTYREFEHYLYSFHYKNQRSEHQYYSLQAKTMDDRMASCKLLDMADICQADFVCWLFHISHLVADSYNVDRWFPQNLLYACDRRWPFEIFARAESMRYMDKLKVIFDFKDKEDFVKLFDYIQSDYNALVPRWEFQVPNVKLLMNIEKLGTRK